MAVGRIKGRCSFELSRHGAGGWRRGWTGNGARGANDRVVGGGGSNGAGRPEVGGWRCSWVEATTSKSDFRSTCYASGSLALHPLIYIYINVQMYKYTYHNCIRTYIGIHLSLFLAVFSPRPRLWHTLTGRIVRRKLPPTFATLISRLDECTCVKVTRFPDSTLRDRGGGRLKLGILRSLGYQRGRKFRVG